MILIVLGTQKFQLNRLLKIMDQYVQEGKVQERVFAQRGKSDYVPRYYESVEFLEKDKLEQMIQQAELVITHSGVGTMLAAIQRKKPVIVFPRLKKYKEHVDDHQLEIANAFGEKNYVLCCHDGEELIDYIRESRKKEFGEYISQRKKAVNMIREFISE